MRTINFRDAYEFDPESYAEGGGLPGLLRRVMQQQSVQQQGADFGSAPNNSPEYDPDSFGSPQGGLLGRLRALQAEQSQYQPVPGASERGLPPPQDPNFRQLSRLPNGAPPATPDFSGSPPAPTQSIQQFEADQAQQAREAATARMARGVRSVARAEAPPPDPIDIAKSAGIGLANGAVNTTGLVMGDIPTGFGYLPNNFVPNLFRHMEGRPQLPADAPDYFQSWTPDELRRSMESHTGEFYQPKTRTGRFAETIGEFVPAIALGAGLGTAWRALRGASAATAPLRELPGTIAKHAIAPGIVVQGLEEAYPESQAGPLLQKAYPAGRRILPFALGAKRFIGL
jgi:hypothetical protein